MNDSTQYALEERVAEEQRHHAGVGEEHEVRAENPRDRAARADGRDARRVDTREVQCHPGLRERRSEPCREVEDEEAQAAHHVFDVVPEDPEEQHVPEIGRAHV